MSEHSEHKTKSICTVAEMARMCGLSRARFYQLQRAGIFPMPVYDIAKHRPHYTEEQQRVCLEVRRRNCGVNGKPILFYARRFDVTVTAPKPRPAKSQPKPKPEHLAVVEGVRSLGLTSVTTDQVTAAIKELFPAGVSKVDPGEVVREVFLKLQRKNSGDNLGR